MRLRIEHLTQYRYSEPLRHAIQTLCLTPADSAHQVVEHWLVAADKGRLHASVDAHGNVAHVHTAPRRATQCVLRAQGVVVTQAQPLLPDDCALPSPWSYLRPTPLACAHAPLHAFAKQHLGALPAVEDDAQAPQLLALAAAVRERVRYTAGRTGAQTPAHQAFDLGQGVCQDQAHVFIAACRSLGLPARYVSGYFHAPDAAALASHAWAEVCVDVDRRAWLAVDVTHACLIDERHVRLAVGPDYAACAPVRGVRVGGGEETLSVQVRVSPA